KSRLQNFSLCAAKSSSTSELVQFGQVVFEPGSRFITDSGYLGPVGFFDISGFRTSGDVGTPVGSDFSRLSWGGFLGLPLISNVCLPVQLSRACGVWPRNRTASLRVATRRHAIVLRRAFFGLRCNPEPIERSCPFDQVSGQFGRIACHDAATLSILDTASEVV
ncbi:hypothetical protein RB213_014043, partial [Colletotrichum asianum]